MLWPLRMNWVRRAMKQPVDGITFSCRGIRARADLAGSNYQEHY
jgi:hypothetical protein